MRISKRRQACEKGYVTGWSEDIVIVSNKFPTTPVTYVINDLAGEEIKGRFYEPELQLIVKEDIVYDVEKVLKTRRRNGKVEYYFEWKGKGYPDKFNSWTDSCSVNSALSNRIELGVDRKVALSEIMFPHSWFNVQPEECLLYITTPFSSKWRDFAIEAGYYVGAVNIVHIYDEILHDNVEEAGQVTFT